MDIAHKLCKHKDRSYKMQRIYKRDKSKFIPVGWICTDCGQLINDAGPGPATHNNR